MIQKYFITKDKIKFNNITIPSGEIVILLKVYNNNKIIIKWNNYKIMTMIEKIKNMD